MGEFDEHREHPVGSDDPVRLVLPAHRAPSAAASVPISGTACAQTENDHEVSEFRSGGGRSRAACSLPCAVGAEDANKYAAEATESLVPRAQMDAAAAE